MTELETIKRAKMYLEKMANGINPLDDSPVPESDLINNVRISRCLFFAADILRQVEENGGVNSRAKSGLPPFTITREQVERFEYSDTPLLISGIAKRLTAAAANENVANASYAIISNWLTNLGMLESQTDDQGKNKRVPTEQGRSIGIFMAERTSSRGPYQAVLYNIDAQHFIVDNIEAILAYDRQRREAANPQ